MPINAAMKRYNYLIAEIESVYHEAALRFGMSDSALMILYVLCGQDGACALADLPYFTGLSKQTLNSAVRKLEAEGTIESVAVGARCAHKQWNALLRRKTRFLKPGNRRSDSSI